MLSTLKWAIHLLLEKNLVSARQFACVQCKVYFNNLKNKKKPVKTFHSLILITHARS